MGACSKGRAWMLPILYADGVVQSDLTVVTQQMKKS
jgi:hypothetical protein